MAPTPGDVSFSIEVSCMPDLIYACCMSSTSDERASHTQFAAVPSRGHTAAAVVEMEEKQWLEDAMAEQCRREEEQATAFALEEASQLHKMSKHGRMQVEAVGVLGPQELSEETVASSGQTAKLVTSAPSSRWGWKTAKARERDALDRVVRFLEAERFASVMQPQRQCCKTCYPLHRAVEERDVELVKALVLCRADSAQVNSARRTPREHAERLSLRGSHDVVLANLPDPVRPLQSSTELLHGSEERGPCSCHRLHTVVSMPNSSNLQEVPANVLGNAQVANPCGEQHLSERQTREANAAFVLAQKVAIAPVLQSLYNGVQMSKLEFDTTVLPKCVDSMAKPIVESSSKRCDWRSPSRRAALPRRRPSLGALQSRSMPRDGVLASQVGG